MRQRSVRGRPRMAGLAGRRGVVRHVAIETNTHRCDARRFGHPLHLRDLSMAHHALHSRVQMLAVRPVHTLGDFVNAHPRNRLTRLCERCKFLDRRFVLRDAAVACHALASCREGHQISRIRVCVTCRAGQRNRQMSFVAVGKRLIGRSVFGRIVRDLLLHVRRCARLARLYATGWKHSCQERCGRQSENRPPHSPFQMNASGSTRCTTAGDFPTTLSGPSCRQLAQYSCPNP